MIAKYEKFQYNRGHLRVFTKYKEIPGHSGPVLNFRTFQDIGHLYKHKRPAYVENNQNGHFQFSISSPLLAPENCHIF